jgi:Protein kinase domain/Sulfatase-modifying factor enzyme 1
MSLEGQQLGEFEIIERIGRGGMGAVYKARQTSLDRIVALKTLQSSLAEDEDYIARFRQEAKVAAVLNHPNLVQVISAGESEGLHWFAMEYVEGESANVRLKRKGRLKPLEAIAIVIHVATALEYGWRKAALIHRDIKPDNIFLSGDGEVKLGDLGLAKSAGQASGLTMTGSSMGTPHYMSPEQWEAMKDVDLRADIYSLGCTLYHLLCGRPPYVGHSSAAVMMKHLNSPAPDLRSAWPECPPELAAAVRKMMQKRPADRHQTYEEVIADLRRACDVLSGTRVPSVIVVTQKPVAGEKKRGVPVMAWLGGGVALLAAIAALVYFARWKKGDATPGGTRAVVSQSSTGEGGKRVGDGASPFTEATRAGGRTVAVATTPQPDATPAPATPALTPQPLAASTPVPSTPAPSATPKPATEMEKWFAQVDGPQQEAFRKQVLKPFETGVTDLRARYLAALDADIARASAAGQLAEALAWRMERQAFEKAQNVAADDDTTPAGVKTLREAFRQQLLKLDQDRTIKAKALHAQYDAILAKNETLLTQRQRLDDALLLKTKREEIALVWLGPSPIITVGTVGRPESVLAAPALAATKDQPFVNSLGMKFVPVPIIGGPTGGQRVLFSVWDTRVQDYEVFVKETKREWPKPDFEQDPTHPAVDVSWEDAQLFCQWLTGRERSAGRLPAGFSYRLPGDHEWSCAVEIGAREDAVNLPSEKSGKINDAFPWGTQWPPPRGAGNYAGEELRAALAAGKFTFIKDVIAGYDDGFVNTSPVGSFAANRFGLSDIGGNVWQWCEDWFDKDQKGRVQRGASWRNNDRSDLLSSYRFPSAPGNRYPRNGFRCVVAASAP